MFQTRFYECAGATRAQAARLANVFARIKPAGKDTTVQLGTPAQQEAIDRCAAPTKTFYKIATTSL